MLLKRLDHITGVDTCDLVAKTKLISLKTEIDKPDIHKFVNVLTSLNDLETTVDDLNVHKLKT